MFPLRVAGAALVTMLGYAMFIRMEHPDMVIAYDSGLRNRIVAEEYVDEPVRKAVLVGSSLGVRLTPDVTGGPYLGPDIFDLAMLGQNSATGLDIVLRKAPLPQIVLVEMNILEHPYDSKFAEEAFTEPWRTLRRIAPIFRLENRPFDLGIIALERTLKYGLTRAGLHSDESVYSPPAQVVDEDQGHAPDRPTRKFGATFLEHVEVAVRRLGEQVDLLQAQHVKVLLLHFPVNSSLDASPEELYKNDEAATRFPQDKYHWYDLGAASAYQTMDGLHLTGNSARDLAIVLRGIVADNPKP